MDLNIPLELEELLSCSSCHLPFDETDFIPKLLTCRHYFCLKCIHSQLQKGSELYCIHCWKRTEFIGPDMKPDNLPTFGAIIYLTRNFHFLTNKSSALSGKQRSLSTSSNNSNNGSSITNSHSQQSTLGNGGSTNSDSTFIQTNIIKNGENCFTHAMPNTLWCKICNILVCRACAGSEDHRNHVVKSCVEAKDIIRNDISSELFTMQKILNDVQLLVLKQRDFLLKILESCTALKTQLETELINHVPSLEIIDMRESLCKAKICLDMLDKQSISDAYIFYNTLHLEKQRLNSRYQEMFVQCNLDNLIKNCGVVFDFDLIKQALFQVHKSDNLGTIFGVKGAGLQHNPILLLANYCISQLYSRHVLAMQHQELFFSTNNNVFFQSQSNQQPQQILTPLRTNFDKSSPPDDDVIKITSSEPSKFSPNTSNETTNNSFGNQLAQIPPSSTGTYTSTDLNDLSIPTLNLVKHIQHKKQSKQMENILNQQQNVNTTLLCNPSVHVYPVFYFDVDINGQTMGRILIEVRNDVAPRMSKNFGALVTHELGFGYKGCQIFQCWENESIITGDFELNNGRGGRSVFEEHFFMPDDTKILAVRGSVGMRRSQKRHDNMGLVGSQFRVILREMRGFTGIFAFIVEGIELVEKISQMGDSTGKPQSNITILSCGKY